MKATKKKRIAIKGGGGRVFFYFISLFGWNFKKIKKYFRQLIDIWTYHVKVYSWYFYWFVTIFSQK